MYLNRYKSYVQAVRSAGSGWEMVSGSNDCSLKVWSINDDSQTGAQLKLIHSINANIKINDLTFGEGNTVLITTEENRLAQVVIR